MLTWNAPQPRPTIPVAEKNTPAHFWTEAKVTDQVNSHAPQRADANISLVSTASAPAFSDAKQIASLRAHFALQGWQLDFDPHVDGSTAYLVSRWGRRMHVLNNIDDVRALLAQIGGAQ